MLIKLGCVAEITVASSLILLGHCLQAIMTTAIMCRETVIIHFHQSQNQSLLNNTHHLKLNHPVLTSKKQYFEEREGEKKGLKVKPERVNHVDEYIIIPSLFVIEKTACSCLLQHHFRPPKDYTVYL